MILQMAKRTVYYPAPSNKVTNLLGGSPSVRYFRTAILVNRKSVK